MQFLLLRLCDRRHQRQLLSVCLCLERCHVKAPAADALLVLLLRALKRAVIVLRARRAAGAPADLVHAVRERRQARHEVPPQILLVLSLLEELVLQQLRSGRTQPRVLLQAALHHVAHRLAEVFGALVLQRGRRVLQSHQQHLHRWQLGKRRVPMRHLQQRDAQRPDICGVVVARGLLHDLRRHPARRAHKRHALCVCVAPRRVALHRRRHTEVAEVHTAIVVHEDVASLDITVNSALAVHIVERTQHIADDGRNHHLIQALWMRVLDYVQHRTAADKGHDHPEVDSVHERGVQGKHVRVVVILHDLRLVHDFVQVILDALQVELLHRHDLAQLLAVRAVHRRGHPTPAIVQELVRVRGRRVLVMVHAGQVLSALL
mmetsp:Transcript_44778/g.133747  ORF Transcript_44778/g.133747 Transcript_44778/m.133747 type:complete len:376 (+) Transcript_44778:99-1226(+)